MTDLFGCEVELAHLHVEHEEGERAAEDHVLERVESANERKRDGRCEHKTHGAEVELRRGAQREGWAWKALRRGK